MLSNSAIDHQPQVRTGLLNEVFPASHEQSELEDNETGEVFFPHRAQFFGLVPGRNYTLRCASGATLTETRNSASRVAKNDNQCYNN